MSLRREHDEHHHPADYSYEDKHEVNEQEMSNKRRVRKLIEEKLERKRLREELREEFDELEGEFDWDDLDR